MDDEEMVLCEFCFKEVPLKEAREITLEGADCFVCEKCEGSL